MRDGLLWRIAGARAGDLLVNLAEGYIAVDWGTSSRRAYLVHPGGAIGRRFEDGRGVLTIPPGAFDSAVAEIFERLGRRPMLLAGTIGAARGWREAPYAPTPATAADLARAILWIEPGAIGIVPGVCDSGARADVMRGEELQALGAVALKRVTGDVVTCHPGTHTKWIVLSCEGRILSFRTAMSGEVFGLLRDHSILSPQMQRKAAIGPALRAGAEASLRGEPPLEQIFQLRSLHLLGRLALDDGASYASGVLIGADVHAGLLRIGVGSEIVLIGNPELSALYAAVIDQAGRTARCIDGAEAFVAGMGAIVERLS